MLTDTTLRHLKSQPKRYKVADREGMYALVSPSGAISFRYDYRLNGRRETFVIGPYDPRGLTLPLAREKCMQARSAVERGESPAQTKRIGKERMDAAKTFCEHAEDWFVGPRPRGRHQSDASSSLQPRHLSEIQKTNADRNHRG